MSRLSMALCLSTSFVAVGIAGFALLQITSHTPASSPTKAQDLQDLRVLLASLEEKVTGLETRLETEHGRLEQQARNASLPARSSKQLATGQKTGLEEQVEALTLRLATLEDEETIAQLAQSGEAQLIENQLRTALDRVADPDASPESRLEALGSIRRLRRTHGSLLKGAMGEGDIEERDIVLPMLELARDTRLDPGLRAEVVGSLSGSQVEELRQPLLDLMAYDQVPEVRGEAVHALMWHLDDTIVRESIRQASQADLDAGVRERAQEYLPKVQHHDRMAAQAAGTAPTGEAK